MAGLVDVGRELTVKSLVQHPGGAPSGAPSGARSRRGRAALVAIAGMALSLAACDPDASGDAAVRALATAAPAAASAAPRGMVDSIIPIDEALRRFRTGLRPAPARLAHASASRDALVQRFVQALAVRDTAAFRDMLVSRAEFAWLVYPDSPQSRPPYELPPALMWFQSRMHSDKGISRAMERVGGRPLAYAGYACAAETKREGGNRIHGPCFVRLVAPAGDTAKVSLFGGIIERGGRWKFLSYANDF